MHSNGVAHRDLKPENLLCLAKGSLEIKVTDFGLAKDFGGEAKLSTSCGTPDFAAPEVIKGLPYTNSVDTWSIAVISYLLLCGYTPFTAPNDYRLFDKILKIQYEFPSPEWDDISFDAKDFIKKILIEDPKKRPTTEECLNHPWITKLAPNSNPQKVISPTKMKIFSDSRRHLRNDTEEVDIN